MNGLKNTPEKLLSQKRKQRREYDAKEGMPMSILDFIAVVSFGLTCFGVGYTFGKDKAQK